MSNHFLFDLVSLFFVALAAGLIDVIAGGGGLITIPALLISGLNPALALGTNKLQASFGSTSATTQLVLRKRLHLRDHPIGIICTFLGAATGTILVQRIDASFLARIIPYLLIAICLYFIFGHKNSEFEGHKRLSWPAASALIGLGIGFYDGFLGPGTGTFLAMAFILLRGMTLQYATFNAKLFNCVSNITSLIFFLWGGNIYWAYGLAMGVGQLVGANIGAHLVISKGGNLVRPVVIVMCIVLSVKLLVSPPHPRAILHGGDRAAPPAAVRP